MRTYDQIRSTQKPVMWCWGKGWVEAGQLLTSQFLLRTIHCLVFVASQFCLSTVSKNKMVSSQFIKTLDIVPIYLCAHPHECVHIHKLIIFETAVFRWLKLASLCGPG